MVRAGRTRAEIAAETGLEEADIERYEAPVLAERRYILERAHAVPVRLSPTDAEEQEFGTVIAERLVALDAIDPEWSSWRDEQAGWMVALTFTAQGNEHRAVWSFEHRKAVLAPLTPDADSLSKQGTIGDRLIPKLRAVEAEERFDSGAFDPERLIADFEIEDDAAPQPSGPVAPDHPSTGSVPIVNLEAEYARRQQIEERAIKTPEPETPNLGQTADLLDALRKRRGERAASEHAEPAAEAPALRDPVQLPGAGAPAAEAAPAAPSIAEPTVDDSAPSGVDVNDEAPKQPLGPAPDKSRRGKGRASIPSWDDILFGTRSDEDPA